MTPTVLLPSVALLAAAATWAAWRYALVRRLMDVPGGRRSHVVPTPRGGGVGPVAGMLAAMLAAWAPQRGVPVAAAVLAVAVVGAWDDHRPLPATRRLLVHVIAAALVAMAFHPPTRAPFAFVSTWFVGVALVNVWNFMDGIDGLASTQAVLASIAFAGLSAGDDRVVALGVAVAIAAFVPFNFPRARVFMGDVGSGAIGLALASLAASSTEAAWESALRATLPLSAFILDAGLTLGRRMLRGERWWEAHAQHLYQGLARRFGHPRVTMAYGAWTVLACIFAWRLPAGAIMPAWAAWHAAGAVLWLLLQRRIAKDSGNRKEEDR